MKGLRNSFWVLVLALSVAMCCGGRGAAAAEGETFYDRLRPGFSQEGGMPLEGDADIAVFLVEFQDVRHNTANTPEKMENLFFGEEDSLTEYYQNASYGKVNITGDVYGWITLDQNREEYENYFAITGMILSEILETYDNAIDFSNYDNDGDGYVDGVYLMYAGYTEGWDSIWWNYVQTLLMNITVDGVQIKKIAFLDENANINTLCHETGHLFGAMDYYDTSIGAGGEFNGVSLMHNNLGELDALSKILLGWVEPKEISEAGTVELRSYCNYPDVAVIYPEGEENSDTFFLVEYNTREKNYSYYVSEGLRVYRVNVKAKSEENAWPPVEYIVGRTEPRLIEVVLEEMMEGDELTQNTVPSTYLVDEIDGEILWKNTGISITDITETAEGLRFYVDYEEVEAKELTYEIEPWIANNKLFAKVVFNNEMFFEDGEFTVYASNGTTSIPMIVRRDEYPDHGNRTTFYLYSLEGECEPGEEYTIEIPAGVLHDTHKQYNGKISFSVMTSEYPKVTYQKVTEYQGNVSLMTNDVIPLENGEYVFFQMENNNMYMCTANASEILEKTFIAEVEDYNKLVNSRNLKAYRLKNGEYMVLLTAAATGEPYTYAFRVYLDGMVAELGCLEGYYNSYVLGNTVIVAGGYQDESTVMVIREDNQIVEKVIQGHTGYVRLGAEIGEDRYLLGNNTKTVTVVDSELNVIGQYVLSELNHIVTATRYRDMGVIIELDDGVKACFYDENMKLLYKKDLLYVNENYNYDEFYKVGNGYAISVDVDKAEYNLDASDAFLGIVGNPIAEVVFFNSNWERVTSYTIDYDGERLGDDVAGVSSRGNNSYVVTTKWGNYLIEGLELSAEETLRKFVLSDYEMQMVYGEEKELAVLDANGNKIADAIVWNSSDESIVTVIDGVLTVTGNGEAVVFAEVGDLRLQCNVSTSGFPTKLQGIRLDYKALKLSSESPETILYLHVNPLPQDAVEPMGEVTWTVSTEGIVILEPNNGFVPSCKIYPVKDGRVTVTAQMGEYTASCDVVIEDWSKREADEIIIQGQTESKKVEEGGEATLSISAYGKEICYQWQYRETGRDEWSNLTIESANSASLAFSASKEMAGQYRCVVTNDAGAQESSNTIYFSLIGYIEPGAVIINEMNFPDAVFRQYVAEICDLPNPLDGTKDGILSERELNEITYVDVSGSNQTISDLRGIEYFYNLKYLSCDANQLIELDVSKNTLLEVLYCSFNQLTELDVSENTVLEFLHCSGNQLTGLDLSQNAALREVMCENNQLTELDISENTALTYLDCSNNQLIGLDVSKNALLKSLYCSYNQLKEFNVSKNTLLKTLYCDCNQLKGLDVSKNTVLEFLHCSGNQLTGLDLSQNAALREVVCENNQLTELDISKNTALTYLNCSNNQLIGLDVSKNVLLQSLACAGNRGTVCPANEINLSTLPNFDTTRVSDLNGAVYDAERNAFVDFENEILYRYDCGNGYSESFSMEIAHIDMSEDSVCDKCGQEIRGAAELLPIPAKPYKIANVVSGAHVYWNAVEGVTQYGVWRSETGKNGTYKWLGNPAATHFTDTKVTSGTTYFYKITSYNAETKIHSDMSEAMGIIYVGTPDITSRNNVASGIALGWQKIDGATGYGIYRKSYAGTDAWARIATIEGNETFEYIDTSVATANGTVYRYTIRALAGSDMKTLSGCRNTGRTVARLSSREITKVTAGSDSFTCTWTTTAQATGYEILIIDAAGKKTTVKVDNYKTGSKTITGLAEGESYEVKVRSYKTVEDVGTFYSDWSEAEKVTLEEKNPIPVPAKPYKITNVVNGVHVYWTAIDGVEKYGLWRSETGKNGTYKWIANPTVAHFTDTKAESGKTYYYKVTAMDVASNTHGEMSDAIGVIYVGTPDITSRNNVTNGIALGWEKTEGATGYAIYRKSYAGNDAWVRIATIAGNDTFTYTDTSVSTANGTIYRYTIRALAGKDMKTLSGCRNTGRTMTRLTDRTLSGVTVVNATSAKCTWSTTSQAAGYEIRFVAEDGTVKTFKVTDYKTGTKTFTGLKSGVTYTVQVRSYEAVEGVGSFYSGWSAGKSVTMK